MVEKNKSDGKRLEFSAPEMARFRAAAELFRAGRFEQARVEATSLSKIAPNSATVHNLMAAIHASQDRLEATVDSLRRSLEIEPDAPASLNNLGFALAGLGRPQEALPLLRRAVELAPDYAAAHNNLGLVLCRVGLRAEGIESFRKALSLRPTYADAHNNLGKALNDAGDGEGAIQSHRNAIRIAPENPGYHDSLGLTLSRIGRPEEAIDSFQTAVSLMPADVKLRERLGNALADAGRYEEAESHLLAVISAKPENGWAYFRYAEVLNARNKYNQALANYLTATERSASVGHFWDRLASVLASLEFGSYDPIVARALANLLDRSDVVPPRLLVRAAVTLAKPHPSMQRILQLQQAGAIEADIAEVCAGLGDLPFFLKLLTLTPVHDEATEKIVGEVRRAILLNREKLRGDAHALRTQVALASHCFCTEYILPETAAEAAALDDIEASLAENNPAALDIASLAAYRPMYKFWPPSAPVVPGLEEVFARQLTEIVEEREIAARIPSFSAIRDDVSVEVRMQYEVNPYPRWQNTRLEIQPGSLRELVAEWRLDVPDDSVFPETPAVLIAGCGTGQHALGAAATYRNSSVTAIDLSLSSLSYGARKARQFGIRNVEFLQGDILEVGALGRKFDVIESVGVLHHMADPLRGWRALRDCLQPGGLMAIGLYSKAARRPVTAARAEIARLQLSHTDIRSFRQALMRGEITFEGDDLIRQSPDFYAMSECRDLLFHVQEHTFTIPQIKSHLDSLQLRFIGFDLPSPRTLERFNLEHPQPGAAYALDAWEEFEAKWPVTFAAMYKFWVAAV